MEAAPIIANVVGLRRYPVKSLRGEVASTLELDRRGLVGDRRFALRTEDGKFGSGKSTRRFRRIDGLFRLRAAYDGAVPVIELPDGTLVRGDAPDVDDRLSRAVGEPVTLAREASISHFDASPVHLVTTASLRALAADERRFRPNVVLDLPGEAFAEDTWIGRTLLLGDQVRLRVTGRTERCVMTTFPQDELPAAPQVLRALASRDACFGVYAEVITPGWIRIGDPLRLDPSSA